MSTVHVRVCQQNVSLLEAEEKTVEQLSIEDGTQILIEGDLSLWLLLHPGSGAESVCLSRQISQIVC